jgi:hypothetical protein
MARAEVVHSTDAVTVIFNGDKRRPEPSTAIIKFPGGHVEVSRCTDGTYWAHLSVVDSANIEDSRIDHCRAVEGLRNVLEFPHADAIRNLALRVSNTVPHFDPNA